MHTSRSCGGEIRPVVTIRTACGVLVRCVAGFFGWVHAIGAIISATCTTTTTSDAGQCSIVAEAKRAGTGIICITDPASAYCADEVNGEVGKGGKGRERKNIK